MFIKSSLGPLEWQMPHTPLAKQSPVVSVGRFSLISLLWLFICGFQSLRTAWHRSGCARIRCCAPGARGKRPTQSTLSFQWMGEFRDWRQWVCCAPIPALSSFPPPPHPSPARPVLHAAGHRQSSHQQSPCIISRACALGPPPLTGAVLSVHSLSKRLSALQTKSLFSRQPQTL